MIRPGEIYLADFEEMEPHPIVIVSREELNRGNWVAAVLITSKSACPSHPSTSTTTRTISRFPSRENRCRKPSSASGAERT